MRCPRWRTTNCSGLEAWPLTLWEERVVDGRMRLPNEGTHCDRHCHSEIICGTFPGQYGSNRRIFGLSELVNQGRWMKITTMAWSM